MQVKKVIAASRQRFAAQIFNMISIGAILVSGTSLSLGKMFGGPRIGFLPFILALPPIMIWLGASIFVYASIAHHPNQLVVRYNRWAGYRFYGASGTLVAFGQPIYGMFENWYGLLILWALLAVSVIPWGLWDIYRAAKESWQDMVIEVNVHA
jgi:hypothetical protein